MTNILTARSVSIAVVLLAAIVAGVLPCAALTPAPSERISTFTADLTIHRDSSIDVREEFVVHSEGIYFKWGLIRFLPIGSDARWDKRFAGDWKDDTGIRVTILEVTQDGERVAYDHGAGAAYAQLRIGKLDVSLATGDHRIVIRYTVDGSVRMQGDRDELYWNVLGHYWQFPVDEVKIHVHFPGGSPVEAVEAVSYAGGRGVSNPRNLETDLIREESDDGISYRATHLGPAQSLSLALRFPKGIVMPPKMGVFGRNRWLLATPILICLYYFFAWMRIGPEPALGSVPVRYEPPADLSPAAVRYVRTAGCDGRTLAAVLAQLAARQCIRIENESGSYKLSQLMTSRGAEKLLAPEESRVLELLFEEGPETIIRPSNSNKLNVYLLGISGQLQKRFDGKYFTWNFGYVAIGYLASLAFAMGMSLTASGRDTTAIVFLTWWFFFCASIVGAIAITNIIPAASRAIRGLGGARQLLPGIAVVAVFGSVFVFLLRMLAKNVSPTYSVVLGALVAANLAWAPALKRLTAEGRQAMRDIEGFRLFLEKVEQNQMQRLNTKDETPGAAIEFVPYAIALEVKEVWGDHLTAECFAVPTTR